jgi:C1A family cysteine protease
MLTSRLFWGLKGPLEEQRYKQINMTDNKQYRGHAVTIIGYDDNICGGSWIIANSLGPVWGHQGYAAIPYSCNSDIGEAYAITQFAGITAGKEIYRN